MRLHRRMSDQPPSGLSRRPLTMDDAQAVVDVMSADQRDVLGRVDIELADVVGDWQRPSYDLATCSVGLFDDAERMIGYAEVGVTGRGDACVHPDHRGQGIGTWLAHWMQRGPPHSAPRSPRCRCRRARPATGSSSRSATGSAGRAGSSTCPRASGSSTATCLLGTPSARPTRRSTTRCTTYSRTPSSSGPSASGRSTPSSRRHRCAAPARALAPAGRRRRRRRRGRRGPAVGVPGRRRGAGVRVAARDPAQPARPGLAPCLFADSFAAGREHGVRSATLDADSRTGALGLYERVGMVVQSTWVNRAMDVWPSVRGGSVGRSLGLATPSPPAAWARCGACTTGRTAG